VGVVDRFDVEGINVSPFGAGQRAGPAAAPPEQPLYLVA
jgi:hypothetical protein